MQLDPDRDRFDDAGINALRERVEALTPALADLPPGVEVEWRRGLPDTLCVPSPAFVEHGAALRERFPTARRLVLFRLNGWGERVAACEALRGVRDLGLACWYADADAGALAASAHVADIQRLTVWTDRNVGITAAWFAGSPAAPNLREYRLIEVFGGTDAEVIGRLCELAGPSVTVTVYDFDAEPVPIAPDFRGDEFLVGKLPDGSQVFAVNDPGGPAVFGARFDTAGRRVGRFDVPMPPGCVFPESAVAALSHTPADQDAWRAERTRRHAVREAVVAAATGFTPAFIRVERFRLLDRSDDSTDDPWVAVGRHRYGPAADFWFRPDVPNLVDADHYGERGGGGFAYDYVRNGEYIADSTNETNEWRCDRTGHVTST